MKRSLLVIGFLIWIGVMMGIRIVDAGGREYKYSYEYFRSLPQTETVSYRTKGDVAKKDTWTGLRFDKWLEANELGKFRNIRLESEDRYMVSLTRSEIDTTECWIVFNRNGEDLDEANFRIIFPRLRELYWIKSPSLVVLEDFQALKLPKTFLFMEPQLQNLELYKDPEPFKEIRAYKVDDMFKQVFATDTADVVMVSADGLKIRLSYPKHLKGAVLEFREDNTLNLKSPEIPGGMWIGDIVYIQAGDTALINSKGRSQLIEISLKLDWELSPKNDVILLNSAGENVITINELISMDGIDNSIQGFRIKP